MTFKDDILEAAQGQPIAAIVVGEMGWPDYNDKGKPKYKDIVGKLVSWERAAPVLDYEYDSGFGAPDCHAITAWTKDWVLFVSQYDGSTNINRVPRNPCSHLPRMPGG